MTRHEYITLLRNELRKLPPEEIVAATEFFEEYFDEVSVNGDKTEEEIIKEIGSPKRAATQIKAEYANKILDGIEVPKGKKSEKTSKASAVWWIILGICSAPVSIPLACVIGVIAVSILCGILGILISIYSGIIGCAVGALCAIGFGIVCLTASVPTGLMFIGGGLALAALSAAAGFGAFIGTRELIKLTINGIRNINKSRKDKKLQKMSEEMGSDSGTDGWTYTEKESNPKDSFNMAADEYVYRTSKGGEIDE